MPLFATGSICRRSVCPERGQPPAGKPQGTLPRRSYACMNTQVSFEKKGNKEKHFAIVVERNVKEELKEIRIIRIIGLRRR